MQPSCEGRKGVFDMMKRAFVHERKRNECPAQELVKCTGLVLAEAKCILEIEKVRSIAARLQLAWDPSKALEDSQTNVRDGNGPQFERGFGSLTGLVLGWISVCQFHFPTTVLGTSVRAP